MVNLDRTIHQGVEIGLGLAVLKGLFVGGGDDLVTKGDGAADDVDKVWLNLAYTFSDFRFDHDADFGNNTLPGAPRHYLRAETLYKHPSGFYAGPNLEWAPQATYVDSANSTKTLASDLPAGSTVYFPIVQECPCGAVERWIETPKEGEAPASLEKPAPGVTLTPKS